MKKRILCIILLTLLILPLLCGCGKRTLDRESETTAVTTAAPITEAPSTEAPISTTQNDNEETKAPPSEPTKKELEEYFENSLFVGDSVLEGIRRYVAIARQSGDMLGNANFLTSDAGVSIKELANGEPDGPWYRTGGRSQYLSNILTEIKPSRIFFLLGLNDLSGVQDPNIPNIVSEYEVLIANTKKLLPDTEICVISSPPKLEAYWLPDYTVNRDFSNELIDRFVSRLCDMCEKNGIEYLDLHTALSDENGALPPTYCSDGYVHLSTEGAKTATAAFYEFAKQQIGENR